MDFECKNKELGIENRKLKEQIEHLSQLIAFNDINIDNVFKQLKENEEKFRNIVENVNDIIFQISPDGLFTYVSPNWTEFLGYPIHEVIGIHFENFAYTDDITICNNFLHKVLSTGKKQSGVEFRVKHKNGTLRWYNANGAPLKDENGNIVSFLGLGRDINEKMLVQQKLLASETKYKAAFFTSPDAVNINKLNGEYVEISEGFTQLTGYTEEDVLGKLSSEINIWSIPEDRAKLIDGLKNNGIVKNLESLFRAKNGKLIPALMSAKIININNEPHILSVTRDITDRKKYEEQIIYQNNEYELLNEELRQTNNELFSAKEKAEESDKLKTAFIQNLSHEIRTPMNAIMGFSELLLCNLDNKDKLENYVAIINQRSADLLLIIDDILDIAKIESGQLHINEVNVNLVSLLKEIEMMFNQQKLSIKKSNLNISLNIPKNDSQIQIITDRSRLLQVFSNLMGNALKFTFKGEIEFGYRINNQQLEFFVSDTGIGIPQDKQEKIFERFFQLKQETGLIMYGNGLGLAITKGLVKLLGGTIWVKSELEKGSTFYFTIKTNRIN